MHGTIQERRSNSTGGSADSVTAGVAPAQLFFITSLVDVAFGLYWLDRSSLLVGPDTALVEGWELGKQDL